MTHAKVGGVSNKRFLGILPRKVVYFQIQLERLDVKSWVVLIKAMPKQGFYKIFALFFAQK